MAAWHDRLDRQSQLHKDSVKLGTNASYDEPSAALVGGLATQIFQDYRHFDVNVVTVFTEQIASRSGLTQSCADMPIDFFWVR